MTNKKLKNIITNSKIQKKRLLKAIQNKSVLEIKEIVNKMDEKDIALFLEKIEVSNQFFLIRSLPSNLAAEVFNLLNEKTITTIVNSLTSFETQKIVSFLYSDDIVELIEDLPPKFVNKILKSCSTEQRKNINHILNYPEGTIGYEMNVEFIKLKTTSKIVDVTKKIRKNIKTKIPEDEQYFYVVDESERLIGYVRAMKLMSETVVENKTIESLIEKDIVSIKVMEKKDRLVELLQKYETAQLPVVDMNNRLIGVINTEQSLQIIQDVQIEDIDKQVGVIKIGFKKYFELSTIDMFLSRIFWLSITFLISTISQLILQYFLNKHTSSGSGEDTQAFIKTILPYLPFILTIVGNVALQSTAMIIKNITLNEIKDGNYLKAFFKEFKVSIFILCVILIMNIPRILVIDWFIDLISDIDSKSLTNNFSGRIKGTLYWESLGVATLTISLSLIFSVFFSTGLPILANKLKKDPSIMSSPLLTTLIDLTVTVIALTVAFLIIN